MTWRARDAVTDTSALLYLHLARKLDLLPSLFARTVVPDAVRRELRAGAEAGIDVPDDSDLKWAMMASATPAGLALVDPRLGAGEREVLAIGVENLRSVAVLDDAAARTAGRAMGVTVTGTLGILLEAKRMRLIEAVGPVMDEIVLKGFRIDAATRARVQRMAGEIE